MKLLNRASVQRVADAVIRDPAEHTTFDEHGARALDPGRRPDDARLRARGDLVADAPRAARAHLLEVPLARDARPHPRRLHADRAGRRPHRPPVRPAPLPRARVRDGRHARRGALAHPERHPRRLRGPRGRRVPRDRRRRAPAEEPAARRCTSRSRSPPSIPRSPSGIARWVYANTQSRIHVLVTHGFLRSLARLELEESAVGRFAPQKPGARGEQPVNVGDTPWPAVGALAGAARRAARPGPAPARLTLSRRRSR